MDQISANSPNSTAGSSATESSAFKSLPKNVARAFLLRLFLLLFIALPVALAIAYFGLRYLLWTDTQWLRGVLTQQIEQRLGLGSSIGQLRTSWEGGNPAIELRDVQIRDPLGHKPLSLGRAFGVLSWRSLLAGELQFFQARADHLELQVERLSTTRWRIGGMEVDTSTKPKLDVVALLLNQQSLDLQQSRLHWLDRVQPELTGMVDLSSLNFVRRGKSRELVLSLRQWTLGVAAAPLATLADNVNLRLNWQSFFEPASDWRSWQGDLQIEGKSLDTAQVVPWLLKAGISESNGFSPRVKPWLDALLKERQKLLAGVVDATFGLQFSPNRWTELRADLRASLVSAGRLRLADLDTRIVARPVSATRLGSTALAVEIERASLRPLIDTSGGEVLRLARKAELRLDTEQGLQSADVQFERIDVGLLAQWFRQGIADPALPVTPRLVTLWRERLAALEPKGQLLRPSVKWDAKSFALHSRVEGASIKAQENRQAALGVPGISGLSGELFADQTGGKFDLQIANGVLEIPRLFEDSRISLPSARTQGKWVVSADHELSVQVESLEFENADAAGSVHGNYRTGGKRLGLLDIAGNLKRFNPTRVYHYLPLVLPVEVRNWVQQAVKSAEPRDTQFKVRGDLMDFPFVDPSSGEFQIQTQLEKATLAFAPDWPPVTQLAGTLLFDRDSLSVRAQQARIHDVMLKDVEANIKSFKTGLLQISGTGQGPAQDMIRFLNETPLGPRLDNFTAQTQVSADAQLELNLQLPLKDLANSRFNGAVVFKDNEIKLDSSLPGFAGVTGRLEFSDQGYGLRDVRTSMVGSSMLVNAQSQADGKLKITSDGSMTASAIRRLVDNPLTRQLSGEAAYRADLVVDKRKIFMTVKSDLRGLQSDLPHPLRKEAQLSLPLVIEVTPRMAVTEGAQSAAKPIGDQVQIAVGSSIRLLFERERLLSTNALVPDRFRILRGALGYDIEPTLPESGMSAVMSIDRLDIDAWNRVLSVAPPATAVTAAASADVQEGGLDLVSGFELMPSQLAFTAKSLVMGKREFGDVVLGASREAGNWQISVAANEVNGHLAWLDTASSRRGATLIGRFAKLNLPKSRSAELEELLEQQEARLPELDIQAEEFTLNGVALGSLELTAGNADEGDKPIWSIQALKLRNADFAFDANGDWNRKQSGDRGETDLKFDLEVHDGGKALERLGLKDAVAGAQGKMSGSLSWLGSPLSYDARVLSGDVAVAINKGQFLKVDPGAAKLIGVLNMQALPRRLFLDFRDVTDEGFAFDALEGQVKIQRGIATTERLTMRGIQAQVIIRGQVSLVTETQNVSIEVRPEINAGGASLAYAALVNPAIGLGTFLAQLLFRRPLQNLFAFTLDVTGPWTAPVVKTRERAPSFAQPPEAGFAP